MFDFIRNHQRLMQIVLLLLVTPGLVLFGFEGFKQLNEIEPYAVVGDHEITPQEFDNVKRNRLEQARQQSPGNFDPSLFEPPEINNQILQSMVTEYLLQQAVSKGFLTSSDRALQKVIAEAELFQKDGRFDKDTYLNELKARGLSPAQHEANLRFNLARSQVVDPLLQGAFMAKPVAARIDDAQLAGRHVQVKRLDLDPFRAQASVTDEEIAKFYADNKARYTLPASADVEYVVLSPAAMKAGIAVTDDELKAYYEQNRDRFKTPEQRRASHILLTAKEGESDADLQTRANKLLAELKANPASFAEQAKKQSADTGSAAQGGDLGLISKGMMVPPFEQAVFALKKGEISQPVKTEFGLHLILLTELSGGEVQGFDKVKAALTDEIKTQKLTTKYAEAQDVFADRVFEGGKSFDGVVKELGLSTASEKGLLAQGKLGHPVLGDPNLLKEIFSEDSIKNKNNTKAVTVGDQLVSARITQYTEAAVQPLDAVKSQVVAQLKTDKALAAAKVEADKLAATLKSGGADAQAKLASFEASRMISGLSADKLESAVAEAILNTPASELPAARVVSLGNKGVVVAWVASVAPASEVKAKADPQMVQFYESISTRAYQEALGLAAREALGKRVGLKVNKVFN